MLKYDLQRKLVERLHTKYAARQAHAIFRDVCNHNDSGDTPQPHWHVQLLWYYDEEFMGNGSVVVMCPIGETPEQFAFENDAAMDALIEASLDLYDNRMRESRRMQEPQIGVIPISAERLRALLGNAIPREMIDAMIPDSAGPAGDVVPPKKFQH